MHSTNFSQFGGKLFDAIAKKLQLLRASRYWPDSPAKLWGSIGGAFLLLLIIMPFRDFLSLLVVVGALAGALTLWKPWEHNFFNSPNHLDAKVVDLNSYRQRKQQAEEPINTTPGLQLVLETNFLPFLDIIFQYFGFDRIMYGSDWPVCLLAAEYKKVLEIITDYLSKYDSKTRKKIMGTNAQIFYNL